MERAAWTDERLDDLSESIRYGFARVDDDIRGLRGELGGLRTELRSEMGQTRSDLRSEMGSLRSELGGQIEALRMLLLRVGGGLMLALVGVIAAILARGV